MESSFPLLIAAFVGFSHAFEADHLLAVSNIVTKRNNLILAIKDGMYWGFGHTSTILLIGLIIIVGKATFLNQYFGYFEAGVGLMLVALGIFRLIQLQEKKNKFQQFIDHGDHHHLAYGVGLVHGLAGSGTMVLLVMTEIKYTPSALLYLLIFGVGSILGMLIAAGLCNLPFTKKITDNRFLQISLILISSALCIGFGIHILLENLGLWPSL